MTTASPAPLDPWDPVVDKASDILVADLSTRTIAITFFADEAAQSLHLTNLTLPQLAERITKQAAASKMELPWLKLAVFGDKRSEKNCLRTNANVLHVTGVEADYDAGEITFATAVATMREARIRALLYTSPSYAPGIKERWRVLTPLSKSHSPERRKQFVARLNGLFGGKFGSETFTLSQAYLFGHLDGAEYQVGVLDGSFIYQRVDLDAGAIFKKGSEREHDPRTPEPRPAGSTGRRRGEAWAQAALAASADELASAGEGTRHATLRDKAIRMGTMIARGWIDTDEVRRVLFAAAESNGQNKKYGVGHFNDTFNDGIAFGIRTPHPDLPDSDPEPDAATSPPADETKEAKPQPAAPIAACTINETLAVFERWLLLRDMNPVLAVLGTVAANLLPGDPVWLGLIAPPSSAKTEILNSVSSLPYVAQAATLTPAGLLSGTPKKQQHATAKGGLLRQIGQFGLLMMKDFGSVLSMRPDAKAEVIAALREIYDGSWTRHLGTEGGRTLSWAGKMGLVFGCTGVIDSHHSVIGAMGERFLLYRLTPDPGQFKRALEHAGAATRQMREELAQAVARLFAGTLPDPRPLNDEEFERLNTVVALAVRLRGAVDRDRHSRELEFVFGAEGTARLGLTLERLLAGLDTLGVDRTTALNVVEAVAMDSVPPLRRRAYEHLLGLQHHALESGNVSADFAPTPAIAAELGLPTNTVRRVLEDLAAYALIMRISGGKGKSDQWVIA